MCSTWMMTNWTAWSWYNSMRISSHHNVDMCFFSLRPWVLFNNYWVSWVSPQCLHQFWSISMSIHLISLLLADSPCPDEQHMWLFPAFPLLQVPGFDNRKCVLETVDSRGDSVIIMCRWDYRDSCQWWWPRVGVRTEWQPLWVLWSGMNEGISHRALCGAVAAKVKDVSILVLVYFINS